MSTRTAKGKTDLSSEQGGVAAPTRPREFSCAKEAEDWARSEAIKILNQHSSLNPDHF